MDKLIRYLPAISGSLIFLGYLNLHAYYRNFDIQIGSYLSTSELIFSFLPVTIPIVITTAFLYFLIGFMELMTNPENKKKQKETKDL